MYPMNETTALLLTLLDEEAFLQVFETVTEARLVVIWPTAPEDETKQALLKQVHSLCLQVGFDRQLTGRLAERDALVRARLKQRHGYAGGSKQRSKP